MAVSKQLRAPFAESLQGGWWYVLKTVFVGATDYGNSPYGTYIGAVQAGLGSYSSTYPERRLTQVLVLVRVLVVLVIYIKWE